MVLVKSALIRTLIWGIFGGALAGFAFGAELIFFLKLNMSYRDAMVFSFYTAMAVCIVCTVAFALISLVIWGASKLLKKPVSQQSGRNLFFVIILILILGIPLEITYLLSQQPFDYTSSTIRAVFLIILLVTVLCSVLTVKGYSIYHTRAQGRSDEFSPSRTRRYFLPLITLLGYMTIFTLLGTWTYRPPVKPEHRSVIEGRIQDTGLKVVLIGLDAATWTVIDPLLEQDELPTMKKLITDGSSGVLLSHMSPIQPFSNSASVGMRSPCLWTTALTGKEEHVHGIQDMEVTIIKGLENPLPFRIPYFRDYFDYFPVNSSLRKARSLWNILSDYGKTVGILGWWPSWPVEEVNGFMVSDWCIYDKIDRKTFPEDLYYRYEMDAVIHNAGDILSPILQHPDIKKSRIPKRFLELLQRDILFVQIGPDLLNEYKPDLYAMYLKGTDVLGHLFWISYQPEAFEEESDWENYIRGKTLRSKKKRFESFKKVQIIESYYKLMDKALGELIEQMDDSMILILCSDHGMGPWRTDRALIDRFWDDQSHAMYSGNHRKEGMIVMYGGPVRKGGNLDGATLLDIAPTILYLLGFPIPGDMPGCILSNGISEDFQNSVKPGSIRTYETGVKLFEGPMASPADQEVEAHLKALGYIN
jgi:predicted AlkP superfamily phosphohydrolase/phosphomutase